ncbi:MAG: hypothetical protein K8F91_11895 [Candidatus Obscuribacterales bacterium]|nr:hypothetical protein [Candidatus Obscuribacterales bacterium]
MVFLSAELLILTFSLLTVVFLWRFVRDKQWQKLSKANLIGPLKLHLCFSGPALLGLLSLSALNVSVLYPAVAFAAAAIIPVILRHIGMAPFLRGLLLLAFALCFTILVPSEGYKLFWAALTAGLVLSKLIDTVALDEESTFEDMLPAFLWLVGAYWTKTTESGNWMALHQQIILGTIVVAVFIRWIQGPFLKEDKLYVKRLTLSTFGGLLLLIMVTKMFVAMEMKDLAAIAGVGFFLSYLLQAMDANCQSHSRVLTEVKQLLFVGIFTLLISRLFGMIGLMVLAASTLIVALPHAAWLAAIYWAGRVLLQSFTFDFNTNMTGINVMHAYTGAALYAGFFLALVLSLILVNVNNRKAACLLFVAMSLVGPAAANFFLHSEPTSSLMVAALTSCVLVAFLSRSIHKGDVLGHDALILVPPLLVCVGILTSELIAVGNVSDSQTRIVALALLAVLSLLVVWLAARISDQKFASDDLSPDSADPEAQD